MSVKSGLEVAVGKGLLKGKRIGLITNHTGVDSSLTQNLDLMLQNGLHVGALFSPEHGFYGDYPDAIPIEGHAHETGIPIYSLYGKNLAPEDYMLENLDALVFDIQDIGARYYTYVATMLLAMEKASARGIPFYVLDRPNPIGGIKVEGGLTREGWSSFVGYASVAIRHGMTAGEIALMEAARRGWPEPAVVPAEGWRRDMYFQDTGLPWVPTSPNAPSLEMALAYPGTCLIEGTNLSEGRGTALPFQVFGAPWVDGRKLASALNSLNIPGARFRPVVFRPSCDKWSGEVCRGVQIHVLDRESFCPVCTGVKILFVLRDTHPGKFSLRNPDSEGRYFLDLLAGGPELRVFLQSQNGPDELLEKWNEEAGEFAQARREFLIYS